MNGKGGDAEGDINFLGQSFLIKAVYIFSFFFFFWNGTVVPNFPTPNQHQEKTQPVHVVSSFYLK